MKRTTVTSLSLLGAIGATAVLANAFAPALPTLEFDDLIMLFEVNSTDGDAEIVFEAGTGEALAQLSIQEPGGQVIFGMQSTDLTGLGLAEIIFESAEPDIASVLAAYPEGTYTVTGVSVGGQVLCGTVDLSHDIPHRPTITSPQAGSALALDNVVVRWASVPNIDHYTLEFKLDDGWSMAVELPANANKYRIKESQLEPGMAYQTSITAVGMNGNIISSEVEFETLP